MFGLMESPGLDEQTARKLAEDASRYAQSGIDLFPKLNEFYENIEIDYISNALAGGRNTPDERYIFMMNQMRMITNDNTRTLFLVIAPLVFGVALAGCAIMLAVQPITFANATNGEVAFGGFTAASLVGAGLCALFGVGFLHMLTAIPYRYQQRINAGAMSHYILAKFTRLRDMYAEARRQIQVIEKNFQKDQTDEIKVSALTWVKAMYWMGQRIYLCETLTRNTIFQIRRNAELYQFAALVAMLAILTTVTMLTVTLTGDGERGWIAGAIVVALGVMMMAISLSTTLARPVGITEKSFLASSASWPRYSEVGLSSAIGEQVGADKADLLHHRNRGLAG